MTDPTPPVPPAGEPAAAPPQQPAPSQQTAPYGVPPQPYGAQQGYPGQQYAPAPPKGLSITSLITGIVGVVAIGWFVPASIAAIITGTMAKKREPYARGFWLTGIITGWVGVGLTVFVVGLTIFFTVILPLIVLGGAATYDY